MSDQLLNGQRWEEFLSDLTPYQSRRPRGEKLDKETPEGPSSISYNVATKIIETFEKESRTPWTDNKQGGDDNTCRLGYNNEEAGDDYNDDDLIVVKIEKKSTELPLNLSSDFEGAGVDRDRNLMSDSSRVHSVHGMASSDDAQTKMFGKYLTKRKANDSISDNIAVSSKRPKIESSNTQDEQEEPKIISGVEQKKSGLKNKLKGLFRKIVGNKKAETEGASSSHSQSLPIRSTPLKAQKQKTQWRPSFNNADLKLLSKWDLSMFSRFIDFEKDVERLNIRTDCVDSSVTSEEMKTVVGETLNMLQTSSSKPHLEDVLYKETNVRIFLSAILNKVCMRLNVGIKTDEQIDFKFLPSCKFDFLFHTRDGKPVGCMEAKTLSTMSNKAFVQSVMKLFVLQQLACKHELDISAVPVFSILSDGQRFIFMQVKGDKLLLEHAKTKKGDDILKIKTTEVMESIFRVVEMTLDCMGTSQHKLGP